jgi:hypothetical protein
MSRNALYEYLRKNGLNFRFLINVAGLDYEGAFSERQPEQIRTLIRLNIEANLETTYAILALRDPAVPHLHALAGRTGLAVQLGVLDGDEVVYLERVVVGSYRLPTRQGGRMPAYCTGLGKAMLAFDDAAAQQVLGAELPARTASTLSTVDRLRDDLQRVRSTGVAFDRQEAYEGLGCVAAPIRNSGRPNRPRCWPRTAAFTCIAIGV